MKCPKCEKEISNSSKFCNFCGCNLEDNKTVKGDAKGKKKNNSFFIVVALVIVLILIEIVFSKNTETNNTTNNESYNDIEEKETQVDKNDETDEKETQDNIKITIKSDKVQNIKIGEKVEIKYSISPWSERKRKITWSSSDDNIVHVYENGEILGMSSGTATVTATIDKTETSITVNVAPLSYDKEGSLEEIANEYYLNEARGNTNYFGKMVKVTGVVNRINVDDSVIFNTGVTIWIAEDEAKYDLACNNENGIVGVSNINRGDKITVVGKMDTMVGRSLHMKECEIYK